MRGSVVGSGAKEMLGDGEPEDVREGKVWYESERRRMLGHGDGRGLEAAVEGAEEEEELCLASSEGALRFVDWEVVLVVDSSEPDERAESERAAVTMAEKDAGSGAPLGTTSTMVIVCDMRSSLGSSSSGWSWAMKRVLSRRREGGGDDKE